MRLPAVDQNRCVVGERTDRVADDELRIGALDLQQHMAMRMGMTHQRPVHVEKRDPAKGSMGNS